MKVMDKVVGPMLPVMVTAGEWKCLLEFLKKEFSKNKNNILPFQDFRLIRSIETELLNAFGEQYTQDNNRKVIIELRKSDIVSLNVLFAAAGKREEKYFSGLVNFISHACTIA